MSTSSPSAQPARRWLVPAASSRRLGLAALGLALFLSFSLSFENFFTGGNVQAIGLNVSSIAIAAVGTMMLVVSGKVDLSIGSQFSLITVSTALVAQHTQSAVLAAGSAILLGALLGLTNGVLVNWLSISPLIVTLGTLAVFRGISFALSSGMPVFGFPDSFNRIGSSRPYGVPMPVIVAIVVFVLGSIFLLRTVAGLRLYAVGGDEEAARRVGVRTTRMAIAAFTVNGALIGLVALLSVSRLQSGSPQVGVQFELDVLTAVILGGILFTGGGGHPLGVAAGVLTIGILNAGLIFGGLADYYQQIAKGALLLIALSADQVLVRIRELRQNRKVAVTAEKIVNEFDAAQLRTGRKIGAVLLDAQDVSVQFGAMQALREASLQVREGEVVCLLGDNGAGKSTLIKVLSGVQEPSHGAVYVDGQAVQSGSPSAARQAGVETVFQDLALCQNLGVAHNLVLGNEPRRRWLGIPGFRDDVAATEMARARLARLSVPIVDVSRPIAAFSGGQRQSVSIARALRDDVKVVILDEPTAALGVSQTAEVLKLIADIARAGHGVILITHDVEQVLQVADRVVVMRLGSVIHDGPADELRPLQLIELMAGLIREPSPVAARPSRVTS